MRCAVLFVLLLAACREAPDRFSAPDPFDSIASGETGRLTWNPNYDQAPVWNESSDSVYYSTRSYPTFPANEGLLLAIPRATGRAKVLLETLQGAVEPRPTLLAPAVSRDRRSIAVVELAELNNPFDTCPFGIECLTQQDTTAANTPLVSAIIRVRNLDGTGAEQRMPIQFSGRNGLNPVAHPFQRQFERDRSQIFRPSWSPDGTRLVYSDGLQLFVWTLGNSVPTPIPNTQDGVWPAWSPSGNVIAFTRLFREGSHVLPCACVISPDRRSLLITRTIYHDRNRRTGELVTINVDGTGARDLGIGEAPTWTADGASLLVARDSAIWRIAADGSSASALPLTAFGFEPAISPDGRWLAFSRSRAPGMPKDYDIWVVGF